MEERVRMAVAAKEVVMLAVVVVVVVDMAHMEIVADVGAGTLMAARRLTKLEMGMQGSERSRKSDTQ